MQFVSVNWLAILIAAVAAWLFGAAYYTALGNVWMAAQGKTLEQCKAEQAGKSAAAKLAPFVVVLVGEVVMAWATYGILVHLSAFSVRGGLISGALLWVGFVLPTMAANNAFGGRTAKLTAIDGAAWLGAMLIIGAIVGGMGR